MTDIRRLSVFVLLLKVGCIWWTRKQQLIADYLLSYQPDQKSIEVATALTPSDFVSQHDGAPTIRLLGQEVINGRGTLNHTSENLERAVKDVCRKGYSERSQAFVRHVWTRSEDTSNIPFRPNTFLNVTSECKLTSKRPSNYWSLVNTYVFRVPFSLSVCEADKISLTNIVKYGQLKF